VGKRHRHRAFPDGTGDPLGRPVADVPRGEQTRHACLERERVARQGPAAGPLALLEQVGAREDVAAGVGTDARIGRPGCSRLAPDADEG
jgi:hypothetical protein